MDMKYKKMDKNMLEKELLIHFRKIYISLISQNLIKKNIISKEYLNNLIRLDNIKKQKPNNEITEIDRIDYLNQLLQRECKKTTAKLITSI